jgi:hypothetical protein
MDIIPLISVKKGRLFDGKDGVIVSLDDLFNRVKKDTLLYVLDYDGIEHNNPNLELYQKLTEWYTLWIDDGPRRLDDVMDTIMAGATNITIRAALWPDTDIPAVRELTEDEIFFAIDQRNNTDQMHLPFMQETVGAVIFENEANNIGDFTSGSILKEIALKYKTYLYTVFSQNSHRLEELGVAGILVDLRKKEGDVHGV